MLLPVVEDLLRRHGPDAGQSVELLERGDVQVHRSCRPGWGACSCRGGASSHARGHDHLLPIGEGRGEVHERPIGFLGQATRARERVGNARSLLEPVEAGPPDRPDNVDHKPRVGDRQRGRRRQHVCGLSGSGPEQQAVREDEHEQQHSGCEDRAASGDRKLRHVFYLGNEHVTRLSQLRAKSVDAAPPRAHTVSMAFLAAVLAAFAATPTTGLYGTVRRGPLTPVCRVGEPCDGPAHVTLVFSRAGRVAGRVHTRNDGSYRIRLRAGQYTVRTDSPSIFERRPRPSTATVPRVGYRRVNFSIDTGIR